MKILILSDSHLASLASIPYKDYTAILHCGDYGRSLQTLMDQNVSYVRGNCDSFGPDSLTLTFFDKKFYITHGHLENVKYGMDRLIYRALEIGCSFCFFGHTHRQQVVFEEGIWFINPGSYPSNYVELTEDEIILHHNERTKIISIGGERNVSK